MKSIATILSGGLRIDRGRFNGGGWLALERKERDGSTRLAVMSLANFWTREVEALTERDPGDDREDAASSCGEWEVGMIRISHIAARRQLISEGQRVIMGHRALIELQLPRCRDR